MKGIEELSVRARRGELSGPERQQLELLLEGSLEARLLHRAGCEFDAEDSILAGDDAAAERVTQRVLARLSGAPPRRRRLPYVLIAAALCVVTVGAAGAAGVAVVEPELQPLSVTITEVVAKAPEKLRAAQHKKASVVRVPVAAPAPTSEPLIPSAAPPPSAVPKAMSSAAAELFAEAARTRREGDSAKAIMLYDSLQSRYPSSAQSRAADIALGMLHARRGASSLALTHFQRYLRYSPQGDLAPEALWGEAQSLYGLGRATEARRSLTRLLQRYPDSAYARAARAKLESRSNQP